MSILNRWWGTLLLGITLFIIGRFVIIGGGFHDLLIILSLPFLISGGYSGIKRIFKKDSDSMPTKSDDTKSKTTKEVKAEELAFKAYQKTGSRMDYHRAYNAALNGNTIQSPTEAELAKIGIVKLGYKEVNNISLADKDVQELPDKQLERYYQAGIKAMGSKK